MGVEQPRPTERQEPQHQAVDRSTAVELMKSAAGVLPQLDQARVNKIFPPGQPHSKHTFLNVLQQIDDPRDVAKPVTNTRVIAQLEALAGIVGEYGHRVGTPEAVTRAADEALRKFDQSASSKLALADNKASNAAETDMAHAKSLEQMANAQDIKLRAEANTKRQDLDKQKEAIDVSEQEAVAAIESSTNTALQTALETATEQAKEANETVQQIRQVATEAGVTAKEEIAKAKHQIEDAKSEIQAAKPAYPTEGKFQAPNIPREDLANLLVDITGLEQERVNTLLSNMYRNHSLLFHEPRGQGDKLIDALTEATKIQQALYAIVRADNPSIQQADVATASSLYKSHPGLFMATTGLQHAEIRRIFEENSGDNGSPSVWRSDYSRLATIVAASKALSTSQPDTLKTFTDKEVREVCTFALRHTDAQLAILGVTRNDITTFSQNYPDGQNYILPPSGSDYILANKLQTFKTIRARADQELDRVSAQFKQQRAQVTGQERLLDTLPLSRSREILNEFIAKHTIRVADMHSICDAAQKYLNETSPFNARLVALFPEGVTVADALAYLQNHDITPKSDDYITARRLEAFVKEAGTLAPEREEKKEHLDQLKTNPAYAQRVAQETRKKYTFDLAANVDSGSQGSRLGRLGRAVKNLKKKIFPETA